MADQALDAGSLRRDRERYHGFLVQAEHQLAACHERIEHLRQAIDALDRLLGLADGSAGHHGTPPSPKGPDVSVDGPARRAAPKARSPRAAAQRAPSPTATPAAPEPVTPPASSTAPAERSGATAPAPKGTDALRLILEADPGRSWSFGDLLDALGSRGWLPASRRPEEGVRISLKRLVERGGAVRVEDGRWRHPATGEADAHGDGLAPPVGPATSDASAPPVADAEPVAAAAPPAERAGPQPRPARTPPPPPSPTARPSSFGRPVGATITEL